MIAMSSDLPPLDPLDDGTDERRQGGLSYVAACHCQAWSLKIWPKDDPRRITKIAFKCRSWRHEGECRLWKGAQDFARIKEGMEKFDYWSHVTLTFYQPPGADRIKLYREGVTKWAKLRKRLGREYGKFRYIQTWERHESGFPHVHLAVSNTKLFERAIGDPKHAFEQYLMLPAVECGFGQVGWLQQIYGRDGMAGYLTKLARELTGSGKDYQIPDNAPPRFRRLRASAKTRNASSSC
jgi:hypothetical protein